jgi:hypothetical protein
MNADNHPARAGRTALPPVSREEAILLREPAERKVSQPAREHGITDLQKMGLGRISDVPQVVTRDGQDWVVLPADRDPLYTQGKLAAPKAARIRVDALLNAGLHFDYLAIGHEVPAGSFQWVKTPYQLEELLAPPMPRSLTVLATIAGGFIYGISSVVSFFTRRFAFSPEAMPSLAPHRDPILFGAVVATPPAQIGDAALFFLLARWKY